jgi:DNA-binding MarR family transcriptional regulator
MTDRPRTAPRQPSRSKRTFFHRAWFRVWTDFVDHGLRRLKRSEAAAYAVLLRDTKSDGTARAGLADLAERGGMSRRNAIRAIGALVKRGTVRVVRPGVPGKATLYTVFDPDTFRRLNPTAAGWLADPPKGDTHVTERVTPMSKGGDTGVTHP